MTEVQATNAAITAKIFAREGKEQIEGKAEEMAKLMQEQAKMYGKKAQELAEQYSANSDQKENIIQEYKQALFEISAEYEKRMKVMMVEKQELQAEEQQTYADEKALKLESKEIKKSPEYSKHIEEEKMLESAIRKALSKGELDVVTQKTEELKSLRAKNPLAKNESKIAEVQTRRKEIASLLEECEKSIEACKNERFEKIEEVTADKNNQLALMPKQNVVQKIFGNLFNRLNGFNKFKNNVIANIADKIETIKTEQLPAIKNSIQEKNEQFLETMQNKREQIKQKALETRDTVVETAKGVKDTVVEKVTGAKDTVVEKVTGAKDAVVEKTQNIKATIQDRVSQTYTSIINRGRQAKEEIKGKLQQSIDNARETQEQLLAKNQSSKAKKLEWQEDAR